MSLKFEIHQESKEENKDILIIDNGEDLVQINLYDLDSDLYHAGIKQDSIIKIIDKLKSFAGQVIKERSKGSSLGSSQLDVALSSEVWPKDFGQEFNSEFGLETKTEQKLIAKIIEKSCKRSAK
ncbi:MAG: hypothetical protein COV02_01910 [Candidatus Terrybacteria bacterium CG10_big_fil_rev_8_21_14_0_10_41_10]|uniref:Uncharacterized protein n=1 Tax=Candidatus Terrybacteria bacterium CG10_big_fil_rev_8_21_14_0_10_41_10 TaxID=1975026 RepID=A0A2M8LAF1_9BACT|nr:MAG: hypothetical protein COV02_01910 [Candidatus Terrybacteria bacterium CG10_big_fil_rev_8_21_14_0_10_41_10]